MFRSYCVAAEARPACAVAILADISSNVSVLILRAYGLPAVRRRPGGARQADPGAVGSWCHAATEARLVSEPTLLRTGADRAGRGITARSSAAMNPIRQAGRAAAVLPAAVQAPTRAAVCQLRAERPPSPDLWPCRYGEPSP